MRILMISPHPTYSPRGTPISVLNRCRALGALGHEIDLITYGIGDDVPVTGLTWLRAPVPGIHTVKVGPSASKVPLDMAVFIKAALFAIRGRRAYDVIHSHEEAGLVGVALSRIVDVPHVYDMGNDLSVVMANYGFSRRHVLTKVAVATETATVRGSQSVIAHFPSIANRVLDIGKGRIPARVVVNVPFETPARPSLVEELRGRWSPDGLPVVLYTGTLEKYQGVPALVEAVAKVNALRIQCRLVIVGGTPAQQDELRRLTDTNGAGNSVAVVGAVSQDDIRSCLEAATVLVSPRAVGSNTPLKLFSYMHSGKPLLATRIAGHLQVLDDDSACLVEPSADALARGVEAVLADLALAADRAATAQRLARSRYDVGNYLNDVADAYVPVGGKSASAADLAAAGQVLRAELVRAAA